MSATHRDDAVPVVRGRFSPTVVIAVRCLGTLSCALMQSLAIPIQSELGQLLGTDAANASWVVTITLLAGAVAMPLCGRFADMYGKKRVLVQGTVEDMLKSEEPWVKSYFRGKRARQLDLATRAQP